MLDAKLRPLIDPPLNRLGLILAGTGLTANSVTLAGFAAGMGAAIAIATGHTLIGLFLIAPWVALNILFAQRPRVLVLIDGGYAILGCGAIGLVLGLF